MYKRIFNKLLIGLVIIFVLFITFSASTNSFAQTLSEEKVYCEATLEDEFADSNISLVYSDGKFYELFDAYSNGVITKENVMELKEQLILANELLSCSSVTTYK